MAFGWFPLTACRLGFGLFHHMEMTDAGDEELVDFLIIDLI